MTTNNAISELPPPFFYIVPKNCFSDYVKFACHSVQRPRLLFGLVLFTDRELFSFLFFIVSQKKNKKTVWGWSNNLERWTGKIVCLWTCLTFIYFISCLLQISGIWIILKVSSTAMCACVFTATFTLCFDPSDLERWWFLELFTGWAQFKYGIKKDKLWHNFGGYSSFLFINGTFLGSL